MVHNRNNNGRGDPDRITDNNSSTIRLYTTNYIINWEDEVGCLNLICLPLKVHIITFFSLTLIG